MIFTEDLEEAARDADAVFILTEWDEIVSFGLAKLGKLMNIPVILDGRNCFSLNEAMECEAEYYSVGRPTINRKNR